jgi:hypothetical protein
VKSTALSFSQFVQGFLPSVAAGSTNDCGDNWLGGVLDHFLIFGGKHMDTLLKTSWPTITVSQFSAAPREREPAAGEIQDQEAAQAEPAKHDFSRGPSLRTEAG